MRPFLPGNAIARTTGHAGEGSIDQFQDQAASFLLGTLHQSRVHLGLDTNSLVRIACLLTDTMTDSHQHTLQPWPCPVELQISRGITRRHSVAENPACLPLVRLEPIKQETRQTATCSVIPTPPSTTPRYSTCVSSLLKLPNANLGSVNNASSRTIRTTLSPTQAINAPAQKHGS